MDLRASKNAHENTPSGNLNDKSDISNQWDEVLTTANSLSKLERRYGTGISFGARAGKTIPLYAVGYSGWKNFAKVGEHSLWYF